MPEKALSFFPKPYIPFVPRCQQQPGTIQYPNTRAWKWSAISAGKCLRHHTRNKSAISAFPKVIEIPLFLTQSKPTPYLLVSEMELFHFSVKKAYYYAVL